MGSAGSCLARSTCLARLFLKVKWGKKGWLSVLWWLDWQRAPVLSISATPSFCSTLSLMPFLQPGDSAQHCAQHVLPRGVELSRAQLNPSQSSEPDSLGSAPALGKSLWFLIAATPRQPRGWSHLPAAPEGRCRPAAGGCVPPRGLRCCLGTAGTTLCPPGEPRTPGPLWSLPRFPPAASE